MKLYITIIILLSLVTTSCNKEDPQPSYIKTQKGFFIINEGNFTWGNSSLSFYDETTQSIENNLFYKSNQVPLGDVAMDMKIINGYGYITVNNSGLIYVINPENAKHVTTITSFTSPRYILPISDSLAYVSDLYSPFITIINIKTNQKAGHIFIGKSTETMVLMQNKVYVCNWSFGNKIFVIDINQHQCIDSIEVGIQPNSICKDKENYLWVLCDGGYNGNPIGHEKSSLWKIIPQSHQAIKIFSFPSLNYPAKSLCTNMNADTLYFIWNDVYKMSIYDTIFPTLKFISANGANFYHITPHSSKPQLIVCDAKNYTLNGEISIYNSNGLLISKTTTGINPSTVCFKP